MKDGTVTRRGFLEGLLALGAAATAVDVAGPLLPNPMSLSAGATTGHGPPADWRCFSYTEMPRLDTLLDGFRVECIFGQEEPRIPEGNIYMRVHLIGVATRPVAVS